MRSILLALICLASAACTSDYLPSAPVEVGTVVYVVTDTCCGNIPIDPCCLNIPIDPCCGDIPIDPCCGDVSITYTNAAHATTTAHVRLPWRYTWATAARGDVVSVSAVIASNVHGTVPPDRTITVAIFKNGVLSQSRSATGGPSKSVSLSDVF